MIVSNIGLDRENFVSVLNASFFGTVAKHFLRLVEVIACVETSDVLFNIFSKALFTFFDVPNSSFGCFLRISASVFNAPSNFLMLLLYQNKFIFAASTRICLCCRCRQL